jgi:NodT family efflux transporter outer membrane factor (OMF) lipoprotein
LLATSVVFCFGWLSSCTTVGPDYEPPQTEMPDVWHQDLSRGLNDGKADLRTWWTTFKDPILDNLIQRATAGNLDTKQAVARILEARAQVGIASGEALPAVDGIGDINTSRISKNVEDIVVPASRRTSTTYFTGVSAEWELDVWGRIARSIESADAGLQATVEDYRDVLVSLYAEVANAYVGVRTAQARIKSALENVESQKKTLALVEDRRRAELASDLEVAQAKLNLAVTESSVPQRRQELAQAMHRLGVLLGERPTVMWPELSDPKPIPQPPKEILVGLPAELLRQRPDVRSAERTLAEQTAQIGVATAELYPRFSLSGFFGLESIGTSDFFDWTGRSFSVGPTMQWNVFDGGRVRSRIQAEDAQTLGALVAYEQTVLDALREVEDSMVNYVQESDRREILLRSVEAAADSVRLVTTLYTTGLTDFQNVQDQERSKAQQDDQYFESQGLVAGYLIDIYRSLGGGWAPTDAPPTTTSSSDPEGDESKTVDQPKPEEGGVVLVDTPSS